MSRSVDSSKTGNEKSLKDIQFVHGLAQVGQKCVSPINKGYNWVAQRHGMCSEPRPTRADAANERKLQNEYEVRHVTEHSADPAYYRYVDNSPLSQQGKRTQESPLGSSCDSQAINQSSLEVAIPWLAQPHFRHSNR
jgi:hypothetical protein